MWADERHAPAADREGLECDSRQGLTQLGSLLRKLVKDGAAYGTIGNPDHRSRITVDRSIRLGAIAVGQVPEVREFVDLCSVPLGPVGTHGGVPPARYTATQHAGMLAR